MTKRDINSYAFSIICYNQTNLQSNDIYDLFCVYEKSSLSNLIVTSDSSYHNLYNINDGTNQDIVVTLKINNEFKRLLNLFEDTKPQQNHEAQIQIYAELKREIQPKLLL